MSTTTEEVREDFCCLSENTCDIRGVRKIGRSAQISLEGRTWEDV